jgi:hypothetical protein
MQKSGGNPQTVSRTDILVDGNPYSIGLFEMNLTNSFDATPVDGQKCSAAFSGPCQGSHVIQTQPNIGHCDQRVVNPTLYADCVAAAESPQASTARACTLTNNGNNWYPHYSGDKSILQKCGY